MFSANILHDYNIRQRESDPGLALMLLEIKMWRWERKTSFGKKESQHDFI